MKVDLILISTYIHWKKKASKKCHALARVITWTENKRHVVKNAFIKSQFSYCLLIWIFHGKTLNNKINIIHEKTLRLVYRNKTNLSFEDLLKRWNSEYLPKISTNISHRNLYGKKDLGKPCNQRNNSTLERRCNCSVYFCIDTICSCSKISDLVPNDMSLELFKKKSFGQQINVLFCKIYIGNIGFVEMFSCIVIFSSSM